LTGQLLTPLVLLFVIAAMAVDDWDQFWQEFTEALHDLYYRQLWSVILWYLLLLPVPILLRTLCAHWRNGKHYASVFPALLFVGATLLGSRFFSLQVLPVISAAYGGIRGNDVHLVVDRKDIDNVKQIAVKFREDSCVSDSVLLIWETEKSLIIIVNYGAPQDLDAKRPEFGPDSTARRFVQIEKRLVKAVVPDRFAGW
jgi:hypothetical protein